MLPNLAPGESRWRIPPDPAQHDLFEAGLTLGSESLAIVPPHDSRVVRAAHESPAVDRLIGAFVDVTGRPLRPSALISLLDSPVVPELDAVVAFRNCVAMSVVLRNRAAWVEDKGTMDVGWSDYFDFHPLQLAKGGRLIAESPALRSIISSTAKYVATPSPLVSATTPLRLWRDGYLYITLGREWRRFYEKPIDRTDYGRALFRSLELAYVASSAPYKHGGSLFEWGVQIGLWVTAIEVLVSVLRGGANEESVLDLLGQYDWGEYMPELAEPTREVTLGRGSKNKRSVNLIQHACHLLYRARNKFMHGNEVDDRDVYPWGQQPGPFGEPATSIVALAPVIYRTALHAYLWMRHPLDYDTILGADSDEALIRASVLGEQPYVDAVRIAYSLSDEDENAEP